jgi:hypothetical protein
MGTGTGTGEPIDYIESSSSTSAQKEKSKGSDSTSDVAQEIDYLKYGTSKPRRIQFMVQRVKEIAGV